VGVKILHNADGEISFDVGVGKEEMHGLRHNNLEN